MISEDYKEFFEIMYEGFTNAIFDDKDVPTMYMVVKDKLAEVIPPPLKDMSTTVYAEIVSAYAKVLEAQYIVFVSLGWAIHSDTKIDGLMPKDHPSKVEILCLTIGDPRGDIDAIIGEVKSTLDGTRYVSEWNWSTQTESGEVDLILPFCD